MGYCTRYELKVQLIDKNTETENVTIDSVIKQLSTADSVDKEQLLLKLEALKNGGGIAITDTHLITKLREFSEGARYALDKKGGTSEPCKWYEHDQDLLQFSKNYPNWLFTLKGEGEESGDLWKKYFVNGKMQEAQAEITFAEFDPAKLK